jgi:hypothetical protein
VCEHPFVASWRDIASADAQNDLDGLLDACLSFATQQLDTRGEFFPFAAVAGIGGETRMVAADPGLGEPPISTAILDGLVRGLRGERGSLRATAIAADVRTESSDAIRVELEHQDGHLIVVLLPYRKKRLKRGIEYGQLTAGSGVAQIWSP